MSIPILLFDGSNNYECWSSTMKTRFRSMGLWDVVETGIQQDSSKNYEYSFYYPDYWKQSMEMKDAAALSIIQSSVTYNIFPWIASAKSSKEAWELLSLRSLGGPIFQGKKLLDLKKEYQGMRMGNSETICEFIDRLLELQFRMKSCGWKTEDKEVVKKILASLPPRFDQVFVEIVETLSVSDVIDILLVHEDNMKESKVNQSVNVEESFEEGTEVLCSSDEITQSQVTSTKIQGELLSLVEENKKMLMEMQTQMATLMQHTL